MYPLVYQRSRVLDDEVVGVQNTILEWSGKGAVIKGEYPWVPESENEYSHII